MTIGEYKELKKACMDWFNVSEEDFDSRVRFQAVVDARHCCWHIMSFHYRLNSSTISRVTNKDNSTVRSAFKERRIKELMPSVARIMKRLSIADEVFNDLVEVIVRRHDALLIITEVKRRLNGTKD